MVLQEAVPISIQAQMHLADVANYVGPDDVSLPATVLTGLTCTVDGHVHESEVKSDRGVWSMAAMTSDGLGNVTGL